MDAGRFDSLVRAFSGGATRRRLMALAAALPLSGVLLNLAEDDAVARRGKRNKKQHHRKQRRRKKNNDNGGGSNGGATPGSCAPNGNACQQNSDCCGGNCFAQVCAAAVATCDGDGCPSGATGCCSGNCCSSPANQCNSLGQCCAPNCAGKQCGADGCGNGGVCGTCAAGQTCNGVGQCVSSCTVCPSGCPFTSVQAAINAAKAGDTITICSGAYTENISIQQNLTLAGAGASVQLDGGGMGSVVFVVRGVAVTIADLTIANGVALTPGEGGFGGGINNLGHLILSNVIVQDNMAIIGGGISNDNLATLRLNNTTVTRNVARFIGEYGGQGGGISTQSVLIVDNGSVISQNQAVDGGGIYNVIGGPQTNTVVVKGGSQIAGNTASQDGGGIYTNEAETTIDGSTVLNNTAARNGGGIFNAAGAKVAMLTIRNNADIRSNRAQSGGGVYNQFQDGAGLANMTVVDSGLSFNTASELGGGLFNEGGVVLLRSSTIFENIAATGMPSGGGMFNTDGGAVTLDNQSAVVQNTPDNCVGTDACGA